MSPSTSHSSRKPSPAKEKGAATPAEEDDDIFSLDFTKLCLDEAPEAEVAVEPPAAPVAETAPAKPANKSTAETASAFESFKAPLELLDFSSVTIEEAKPIPPEQAEPKFAASPEITFETPAEQPVFEAPAETVAPIVKAPTKPATKLQGTATAQAAAKAAPKPPVDTAATALLEIARQHAAGKTAEASATLEAVLRAGTLGKSTERGWGMLFDLLQILNRRQAFENLADAYAKRFERSAPAWLDATGEADNSLETGGAAYVALSGILSAASENALKKLVGIAESNPTVRLGLLKVTDADNDGSRLLLDALRAIKKCGRECLLTGADEFSIMLASKVEMMQREREETWLLLLELYQRAGNQTAFEDTAIAYAVTFEVSPPSWEEPATKKTANKPATKGKDPLILEGELLAGMNSIALLAEAAKGRDAITIETDHLARIDEVSAKILLDTLTPLHAHGLHIQIRGANLLVATLLSASGLDKIATLETRRR